MENNEIFKPIFEDAVKQRDSNKRTMTVIVSNEDVNRYGHKVMVNGWDYKNYLMNPVVLVNHDSMKFPVAKATKVWKSIKKDSRALMATVEFLPEGVSPEADLAFTLYDNGFMTSVSPGYMVDYEQATYSNSEKEAKVTFNKQELLEISLATVPANPGALKQNSMIKECLELGMISEETIDKIEESISKSQDIEADDISVEKVDIKEIKEQNNKEDVVDYTIKENQEDLINNTLDPFEEVFIALDELLNEQKSNDSVVFISDEIIEELQDNLLPKDVPNSDFEIWISKHLN